LLLYGLSRPRHSPVLLLRLLLPCSADYDRFNKANALLSGLWLTNTKAFTHAAAAAAAAAILFCR
jgi:hypothetical protein